MSTMSHNANMISLRTNAEFERRVSACAELVDLSTSDLVRAGLNRVLEEIEKTGCLRIRTRKPAKKPAASKP